MSQRMTAVIFGTILIVIGLVLFNVVGDQAATSGADAQIASFAGARSVNDLVPLVFISAIVILGVGLIGLAAAGFAGMGSMSNFAIVPLVALATPFPLVSGLVIAAAYFGKSAYDRGMFRRGGHDAEDSEDSEYPAIAA